MSSDGFTSARFRDEVFERFKKFQKAMMVIRKGEDVTQSDALDALLKKAGY